MDERGVIFQAKAVVDKGAALPPPLKDTILAALEAYK